MYDRKVKVKLFHYAMQVSRGEECSSYSVLTSELNVVSGQRHGSAT
jgi:hypothetical protein